MNITPMIYSVYARADENNKVIKIFSTCFEGPSDTDFPIKSGSGDEFVHVGYYQIFNTDGTHKYCIENGTMRECTAGELEVERATFPASAESNKEKVARLEETVALLNGTMLEMLMA